MRWQKKLTKKEHAHLKDMGTFTLAGIRRNRTLQIELCKEYPEFPEPCWDCKFIAKKLNLE